MVDLERGASAPLFRTGMLNANLCSNCPVAAFLRELSFFLMMDALSGVAPVLSVRLRPFEREHEKSK